ncbi:MAG TPA: hypothetical protein VKR24_11410 [Candidatus Limnocylindrales bacterium]|nr:hypothetical protein [Candidatus Limnocylindrales bacterium]
MIEFDAYAVDCRLFGRLEPGDGRLSDLLNASVELRLSQARIESIVDDRIVSHALLEVPLNELYAVVATGSRGDPTRRIRTRTIEVVAELGPYEVIGEIHGAPASNPLVMVGRRPPWVPLTKAQISYRRGSEVVTDERLTLIINRTLARSLRAVDEDAERLMLDAHDALPRVSRRTFDPSEDDEGDDSEDEGPI